MPSVIKNIKGRSVRRPLKIIQPFVLVLESSYLFIDTHLPPLVHPYLLADQCQIYASSANEEEETTTHFLLQCSALSAARCEHLLPIMQIFHHFQINIDPEIITKYIIDQTHINNLSTVDNTL